MPPRVEYSLTPMGRLFIEPIEMLYAWAAKNDDVVEAQEEAEEAHAFERQSGEGSIVFSYRFVRRD